MQSNLGTLLCGKLGKKLVTQMARTRAGFRMVSCSVVSLVVSSMNGSEIPTGMGLAQQAQARASGSPRKQLVFRSCPPKKDSLEEGVRDFNLKNL